MRGLPDEDTQDGVSPLADVEKLVIEGRYGRADLALRRLEALIPSLAPAADTETLLLALYGRALLLRQERESVQTALAACDVLERAAHERDAELWVATACATRARFRVDSGDIGGATADLARADDEATTGDLTSDTGYRLLDAWPWSTPVSGCTTGPTRSGTGSRTRSRNAACWTRLSTGRPGPASWPPGRWNRWPAEPRIPSTR